MTATQLLRDTQKAANLNKTAFAAALGISQSLLSLMYLGQRNVSARTLRHLGNAFPETMPDITTLFFAGEHDGTHGRMTDGN